MADISDQIDKAMAWYKAHSVGGKDTLYSDKLQVNGEEIPIAVFGNYTSWGNESLGGSESSSVTFIWEAILPRFLGGDARGPIPYLSSYSSYKNNNDWQGSKESPSDNDSYTSRGSGWADPHFPIDRSFNIDYLNKGAKGPEGAADSPKEWHKSALGDRRPRNTFPDLQRKIAADPPAHAYRTEWLVGQSRYALTLIT